MACLLPQFKCQPDTFAISFRAPPTKISGPSYFQALCVLSTMLAPTLMEAEKLQISSLEARSNSFSGKSTWTHVGPPTEANLEATLAKETLLTSDNAAMTAAAAAEAIALAKAAVKVAKDAKALVVNNNQYGAESRPTILSEVNSLQSSWDQVTTTEEVSGVGAFVERSIEESSDLEPTDDELKFLEEQFSNTVAVKSIRQTERKARRAKAVEKAAANAMYVKSPPIRRKKRGPSKPIHHADPLRHVRAITRRAKLLTAAEERELSAGIQDLLKLERLQQELTESCGGEPTFAQWATAVGVDERTLKSRLNHGLSCKEKMIKCNVRLVVSIAKKYIGAGLDLQDLIQHGCRGLIRASEKFDASRGFKFSTYAYSWIRQAIQKGLTEKSRFIRTHVVDASYKVKRAREQFVNKHRREPNHEELAVESGLTTKKLDTVLRAPKKMLSLDQKIGEDSAKPSEYISDPNQESVVQVAMREFMRRDIDTILDSLTPAGETGHQDEVRAGGREEQGAAGDRGNDVVEQREDQENRDSRLSEAQERQKSRRSAGLQVPVRRGFVEHTET